MDPPPYDDLEDFGSEAPFGFKDDMWDFMSGCGFNPMSGSFGGW
jgi:hypothetical protein